jgi:hypothetical protein
MPNSAFLPYNPVQITQRHGRRLTLRKFQRLLTVIIFVVLCGVSLTAAFETVFRQPHDRAQRDQAALRDWLLTANPAAEPESVLRDTARRAAAAFRQGFSWNAAMEGLSDDERARMVRNFQQVTRVWLLDRVDAWQARPKQRRTSSVDFDTRAVLDWNLPPAGKFPASAELAEDPRGKIYDQSARLDRLEADARTWLDEEPPERRRQVREYLGVIRGHLIGRGWMRWLPGGR